MRETPIRGLTVRPGHQAGVPALRVEATTDPIHPFAVQVGYRDGVRVPMTAAGLRSLRDALTALLEAAAPAEADDFVADWARAHGATVYGPSDPPGADVTELPAPQDGYAEAA